MNDLTHQRKQRAPADALKSIVDLNTLVIDLLNDPQRAPFMQGLLQKMQEGMGTMLEGLEASDSLGEGSSEMF